MDKQQTDKRYAYDQRGNRIHQWLGKDHAIQTQYRYSAENELTEVVEQKRHIQTQVQFQYDALGRRIQKEVIQRSVRTGEITSHYKHDYLWMGDVILEDRCTELLENSHSAKQAASDNKVVSIGSNSNADTGELTSNAGVILYLHEPSAFRPLAQIRSEQTVEGEQTESIYYYHLDHIGTPLELTDEQGRIVWQANYTGFGQARIINSGITNLIRYPGQYEDSEIGLHYNRFRYYDPSSGQYTQQDPIGLMGGEQLSQYVADPVDWVNELGLPGSCPTRNRKQALNKAKDLAGIPRSQQPVRQWSVGDDIARRGPKADDGSYLGTKNYTYSTDKGSHGRYYEYVDQNGHRKVVVEHTADPRAKSSHTHAGEAKDNPRNYDFKRNRYRKVIDPETKDHHIYYE